MYSRAPLVDPTFSYRSPSSRRTAMPAIIGLLLPGVKLLTRVPLIGVVLCALGVMLIGGIAAVLLAIRLGGLLLRIVLRGPLIGVPLLAILVGLGVVPTRALPLTKESALALVQQETMSGDQSASTSITPTRVAVIARQVGAYATAAFPQLLPFASRLPAGSQGWVTVANTDGEGAYLRATPRLATPLRAWAEGTKLEVVGDDADGDGYRWKRVRDPNGQLGWIAAEFVQPTVAS
jgi:hypothetical protein